MPVAVGLVFGVAGVMGLLVGGLSSGFVLAVFMANAGGAWDNAKKMVEEGHFGGKGSECHKATVVGDTVGDPFKDTSGPSLNILDQADVYGFHRHGRAHGGLPPVLTHVTIKAIRKATRGRWLFLFALQRGYFLLAPLSRIETME